MNKKSFLWIALDLIFVVVFNIAFFTIGGFDHTASVWLSYAFLHFAYLMVIITPVFVIKKDKSVVLGFPVFTVSYIYFFVEFFTALLFSLIQSESIKAALVIQVIYAGIYGVFLLGTLIVNEDTQRKSEGQKKELVFVKDTSARVKLLIGKINDESVNKSIEKVYDAIHSSPCSSGNIVSDLENEIQNRVFNLEMHIKENNSEEVIKLSENIINLVNERNTILKNKN